MSSFKQIEANRRNALKAPAQQRLKAKSVRAAMRCARAYRRDRYATLKIRRITKFEAAVTADYEAETAVERELVLRLSSLYGGCVAPPALKRRYLHRWHLSR